MKILIVEPLSLQTHSALKDAVDGWGYRGMACDLGSVSKLLETEDFGIIVVNSLDFMVNALEVCRALRMIPDASYSFLVIYAGDETSVDVPEALSAGADEVVFCGGDHGRLLVMLRAAERILDLRRELVEQNTKLRELSERLGDAYQSIQNDLTSAAAIQMSLLPGQQDIHPKFCMDSMMIASSFLAGDTLDYFLVQDRYVIFYHLDVSGHGVAPALLSVTLHHLLSPQPGSPVLRFDPQREVKRVVPPIEVVGELNQRFHPQGDTYFTMVYGVLDTETGEIRFCQAGHPSPIHIGRDGTPKTVEVNGFPVALWEQMVFDETILHLEPGEQFVLYSDGVLCCKNPAGELYTLDRFQAILRRNANEPTGTILQAVREDLERWSDGRSFPDDISVLILRAKEKASEEPSNAEG